MSNLTGRKPTPYGVKEKRPKSTKGGRETSATALARKEWFAKHPCCFICGTRFQTQVHHIIYGSKRYDHPANWITVCGEHHRQIHEMPPKEDWFVRLAAAKVIYDFPHADTKWLLLNR